MALTATSEENVFSCPTYVRAVPAVLARSVLMARYSASRGVCSRRRLIGRVWSMASPEDQMAWPLLDDGYALFCPLPILCRSPKPVFFIFVRLACTYARQMLVSTCST